MANILRHGEFYGEMRNANRMPGLVLTETIYPPRLCIPQHSHEDAYFCFVLQGSYTEVYGSKARAVSALTLAFHPATETHSENFDDSDVRSFNVAIESSWRERIREYSRVLDRPSHFQGGLPAMLAMKLYGEFRRMDPVSPLAIEGLVLELMAEASRQTANRCRRRSHIWLKQANDLLRARFNESLELSEIARQIDVHPVHLAREYRRCFGCTMGEYLRQLRTEYACRALLETDTPLRDIALDAGFFDQSHLCRVFRRLTGMTPREYRSPKQRRTSLNFRPASS